MGDLGNVIAGDDGIATFELEDHLVQLSGATSVIGRSLVVHADAGDLDQSGLELTATTGNPRTRLACGVIGTSGPC